MFKPIFDNPGPITWLVYSPTADRSAFEAWLLERPPEERVKLLARMRRFAEHGDWNARLSAIKQLDLPGKLKGRGISILEVKSHQERVLFVRSGNRALVVAFMVKKDDWSKRDARVLEAAVDTAELYLKLQNKGIDGPKGTKNG